MESRRDRGGVEKMDELNVVYLLGAGGAAVVLVGAWLWLNRRRFGELDIQRRSRMFSPAERNFFDFSETSSLMQ